MTVVHLNIQASERIPTKMRGTSHQNQTRRELLFGLAVTTAILGAITLAAFNGGLSLEAGPLQMTLDASLSNGLHLSFASL